MKRIDSLKRTSIVFSMLILATGVLLSTRVSAAEDKVTLSQGAGRNKAFVETDWNIKQDMSAIEDEGIVLTKPQKQQTGYAYLKQAIQLGEGCEFSLCFDFTMQEGDASGADGIAFVIQRETNSATTTGQGLGYEGLSPSLAVEFDSYSNGGYESQNHIGIMLNGDTIEHKGYADVSGTMDFNSNNKFRTWIEYHNGVVEVRLTTVETDGVTSRPATALASLAVDLYDLLGQNTVFVGCSSATGGSYAKHVVTGMTFDNKYHTQGVPLDCDEENTLQTPSRMSIYKWTDKEATITPTDTQIANARSFMFFEKENDILPIATSKTFTIPASVNQDTTYYYAILSESGKQSARQLIQVKIIQEGTYSEKVETDSGFAPTTIMGMKECYALPNSYYEKGSLERVFAVKDATNLVTAQEKQLIEQVSATSFAGQDRKQLYMDLSIEQSENGAARTKLSELTKPVTVKLSIPTQLRDADSAFDILRIHEGVVSKLDCVVDKTEWTIQFSTDQFSIYALTYTEHKKSENQQNNTPDLDADSGYQDSAKTDVDPSVQKQKKEQKKERNKTVAVPKTGDASNPSTVIVWMIGILLVSFAGILICIKESRTCRR